MHRTAARKGLLRPLPPMDLPFLVLVLTLVAFGLVMLCSASSAVALYRRQDAFAYVRPQLLYAAMGLAAMWMASRVDYHIYHKLAWPLLALSLVLLTAVLFMPEYNGCKRWLVLPGLGTLQPSEIAKFAVVLGGNIAFTSGELREGMASAAQLHDMGYGVFVLRYRIWMDMGDNAPLEDLARAVEYITAHAEELGVQPEDYALVGFSSGGQVAGVFANSKRGYGRYHVAKPGVLLLGYSVSDTSVMKPVYYTLYDIGTCGWRYYWTSLDKAVEEGYPPVYFWRGNDDSMLGPAWMPGQYNDFEKALQACNVPYKRVTYQHAPHAIGTGNGTDAEGWMTDAVAFWEAHTTG